jgi:hypothetical protein
MTPAQAKALAASLDVGLRSRGVCCARLSLVAMELEAGDGRVIGGRITAIAPTLWAEGLGDEVRTSLERSRAAEAKEAHRDLDERAFRSNSFRAVVRRLAEELQEDMRRAYLASLN